MAMRPFFCAIFPGDRLPGWIAMTKIGLTRDTCDLVPRRWLRNESHPGSIRTFSYPIPAALGDGACQYAFTGWGLEREDIHIVHTN